MLYVNVFISTIYLANAFRFFFPDLIAVCFKQICISNQPFHPDICENNVSDFNENILQNSIQQQLNG